MSVSNIEKEPDFVEKIIGEFIDLQRAYSFTKRASITPDRYVQIAKAGLVDTKDYGNEVLRESLTEHVGHLPILASFFHPYVEHSNKINLGRVLIMLSIHDIGETVVGEINSYAKTKQNELDEQKAALVLMHPNYKEYFLELEANETFDAKYANAIDKIAPNMVSVTLPSMTLERAHALNFGVDDVIKKKRKYMEWDTVLLEVFDLLMSHYKAVENGEKPIFKIDVDDVQKS